MFWFGEELHLGIEIGKVSVPFLGSINISVVVGWIIVAVMIVLLALAHTRIKYFKEKPSGLQNFLELVVEASENLTGGKIGKHSPEVTPYILAVCTYLGLGCLIELIGLMPLAADINMTASLGICSFFVIHGMAVRHVGVFKHLESMAKPKAFMLPIKLLTELALPVSMACRMYGNVLAGLIIMELIYFIIPIAIPAALAVYFNLFHVGIQVYIFAMLTLSFTEEALEI